MSLILKTSIVIRWVGDRTAYFYLKSVNAHFCES